MTLRLYYHPLSSFCHKALIALYETNTPFEAQIVDLGNAEDRAAFLKVWPVGKFPVLRDEARDWTVPESSIIIEYLDQHYPGPSKLVPGDRDLARRTRMHDRFFDLHIHTHMQKIVGDRLRAEGQHDPTGVAHARAQMETALAMVDEAMKDKTWAMGEGFTLADCSAAPALFYADKVAPLKDAHPVAASYLARLMQRPSYARVLKEAEPYFAMFPG